MPASPAAIGAEPLPPGGRAERPGDQRDPGAVRVAVQFAGPAERPEQVPYAAEVLGGEDLGRREQSRLAAGVDDLEHRPQRAERLAGTDLALQQPVHRVLRRQVVRDLYADRPLAAGQLVRQRRVESGQGAVGAHRSGRGRRLGRAVLALHQGQLYGERLVPLQPLARGGERLATRRPVDLPHRRTEVDQPTLAQQGRRASGPAVA